MNIIKRNSAVFILLFTVLSLNSGEFFHHHENESLKGDDSKCQACLLHNVLSTIDITGVYSGLAEISSYETLTFQNHSVPDSDITESSLGRAPPVSHI